MDNGTHKLYDYEVMPPASAWPRIAEELEAAAPYHTTALRLQAATVAPPAGIWSRIAENLQDEAEFSILAAKLNTLHIAPPAAAWSRIEAALGISHPVAKVVPLRAAGNRITRYAVAAGIVGLVGFFGYKMTQRAETASTQMAQQINNTTQSSSLMAAALPIAIKAIPEKVTEKKIITDSAITKAPATEIKGNVYAAAKEKNKEMDGRYIVLMTENGDVVRMSKKLGNMADCIAGENGANTCTDQIAHWQKELATAPLPSSPDNFLDILELANSQEGI